MSRICDVPGCGQPGSRYIVGPVMPEKVSSLGAASFDLCAIHREAISRAVRAILKRDFAAPPGWRFIPGPAWSRVMGEMGETSAPEPDLVDIPDRVGFPGNREGLDR